MIRKKNDTYAYGNAESDNDKTNARRKKKKKTEKKATIPLIQQLA